MPDYTPRSNKAEWHPTYLCDLNCTNCNRCCFLPPTTPDMTLDDARSFVQQAKELDWHPEIYIVGGEPTLYAQLFELLEIAQTLSPGRVAVFSNGYSDHAKKVIDEVRSKNAAQIYEPTLKPHGSVKHHLNDMYLAACEFGDPDRKPCSLHSCGRSCGTSVDSGGYTMCPCGGAIDGIFQLHARTKRLADLFNVEFAEKQTRAICRFCGWGHGIDTRRISQSQVLYGALMSPLWQKAVERIERAANHLKPIVAVVGPTRSGTSAVASVLHALGVSMGESLPSANVHCQCGSYEETELYETCLRWFQWFYDDGKGEQVSAAERRTALRDWRRRRNLLSTTTVIGAKMPMFCLMVNDLLAAWPDVRLIYTERPFDEIERSLKQTGWSWGAKSEAEAIRQMLDARDSVQLAESPLRINYSDLIERSEETVDRIIAWLGLDSTNRQAAIAAIDPSLRHFTAQT